MACPLFDLCLRPVGGRPQHGRFKNKLLRENSLILKGLLKEYDAHRKKTECAGKGHPNLRPAHRGEPTARRLDYHRWTDVARIPDLGEAGCGIAQIGPVDIFVKDLAASVDFYTDTLGFKITEEIDYQGHRVVFLRNGTEHHSLGLFPKALREPLGLNTNSSCLSFSVEVGSYQQLKNGVAFLEKKGVTFKEIPSQLHPGIDFAAYATDPEGHCIKLYYYMEQVGWDGKPRPQEMRRESLPVSQWPEVLDPMSDTYADQTFQGPLG